MYLWLYGSDVEVIMYIFFYCYFLMCYFDMYVETQVCTCDYMGDVEVIIYVFFYCHFLMCYFDTYVETQVCTCDLSFYFDMLYVYVVNIETVMVGIISGI